MATEQSLRKKIIINLVIPLILFFGWFGLIFFQAYLIEKVFTILTREYSRNSLTVIPQGEIYQDSKIIGEFISTDNNMGIVGFRFWTFYRLNDDYLIFRIRDKNSKEWYYQNKYKADQFQPNQYFTFGFPIILDSKGKTYVFEIESSQGRPGVAVGVSEVNPTFIIKYKYSRKEVTSSTTNFIRFSSVKFINLLSNAEFKATTFIYLTPLLIYIITLTQFYRTLEKKFVKFLYERVKFVKMVMDKNKLDFEDPVNVLLKGIFLAVLYKYQKNDKRIVRELEVITEMIVTLFGVSTFKFIELFSKHPKVMSVVVLIIGSTIDSQFVKTGDLTIVTLLTLWIYNILKYKLEDKLFFVLSLFFLVMSGVFFNYNFSTISERYGAWAWIFLTITVILNVARFKNNPDPGN